MSAPTAPSPGSPTDRWLLDLFVRDNHPLARAAATRQAPSAWEALEAAGVPRAEVAAAAERHCGVPYIPLGTVDPAAAELLPRRLARRFWAVPVGLRDGVLRVVCADPLAGWADELAFATGRRVQLGLGHPGELREAMNRLYPEQEGGGPQVPVLSGTAEQMQARILREALAQRSSDVHLEPKEGALLVRFRVDGLLHDAMRVPGEASPALVSRFKVTAGVDISDRIRPQDGRCTVTLDGRKVDLRISTLPLEQGQEKVVVRLLDSGAGTVDLASLGFLPAELHRVEKLLQSREGMVLVTGPTGSGKTTTLYSVLRRVQGSTSNITTIEDPVEIRLDGINQVQVNEKAGLTFASALRSMLRQDPDVILVGEVRDGETAGIALKASMTGHLVLSTLHTNDAVSAVARLTDMGVDLGALSGALKAVIAQRLLRRLCADCCQPVQLSELPVDQQALLMGRDTRSLRTAVGCARCRYTGFTGRMVVPEVMLVTAEMQRLIARQADYGDLARAAGEGGMLTLWEAGLERVLQGMTSLHELLDNVAAPLGAADASPQSDVDALLAQLLGGGAGAPAATPAPVAPPAPSAPAAVPARLPAGGRIRVLVADDDREARQALRRALEADGFGVIEAADGEAALAYAQRLRPDWLVTEIALPRLDGIGLLQALAGAPTAVVVYTTQTDAALLDWVRELGAVEVLDRSVDVRLLTARLQAQARNAA
ncbi:MAG TPA: ATPase, T2SS/T4P/T4SS family [Longimicrobium sp.]|nr:ATPase, T2SS/T4P/T4SS family [Longimicrobium sp.]